MNPENHRQDAEAIAIIGLAGRFPGASSVAQYWRHLCDGVESITVLSDKQLSQAGVTPEWWENPNFVRSGGIVEDADTFDAQFFGLNARETEIIDPQQRVFLECAWEALEDAGYDPASFAGDIGLFAGAGMNTYGITSLFTNPEVLAQVGPYQVMLGNDKDFLATRVAYKLNLKGPAVAVQTACSTSLVAVQMAFESLRRGECDMALAGGVSIRFPQHGGYEYAPGMILSPDGHCRAFDADAAGTVPGGGAGIVVLRRLSDALADGDQIYAVIRGASINNDGAAKVGYSAPSVEGQSRVIARSMEMAGFAPRTVSYVEAHGTGTEVGDPIEIMALNQVFGSKECTTKTCAIGSVKTNIGHLDTAAGVAGLIKAALAIKYRVVPPTLHFKRPNPHIDFDSTPFFVNTQLLPYEKAEPFRVGVSSFGIGGTNAHVSLEEYPQPRDASISESSASSLPQLLILSARSEEALQTQSGALLAYFEQPPSAPLSEIAFTLQAGRRSFRHRCAFVARDAGDACDILRAPSSQKVRTSVAENNEPEFVFLFPGQGSQYVNMGRGLYEKVPRFRDAVDECARELEPLMGLDLRALVYPESGFEGAAAEQLNQTAITQPALFAIEYACAQLWMHCGIQPTAMLGHSVGEYVAACVAGVFSLKDALRLIANRGRLVQSTEAGAMLAVAASEQVLIPLLETGVSIAALNAEGQSVATGPVEAIERLEALLTATSIEHKRLRTSHAFHSALLDPVLDSYREVLCGICLNAPTLPYLSNLTGMWITREQAVDPEYWVAHLRNTVRFADCTRQLSGSRKTIFIEAGPGETLLSLLRQDPVAFAKAPKIASLRTARSKQEDYPCWLESVGQVWLAGGSPDWRALHIGGQPQRTSLPTYPFERQRYWIQPGTSVNDRSVPFRGARAGSQPAALAKQTDIGDWFFLPSWKRLLPLPATGRAALAEGRVWLLLTEPESALGSELRAAVRHSGRVIEVFSGISFKQLAEDRYQLDPGNRDHWGELMRALTALSLWPERIVHTWTLGSSATIHAAAMDSYALQSSLDRGFFSILFLTQAIGDSSSIRAVDFKIVTTGSCSVAGEVAENLAAAPLAALCRVIPLEYPNIRCQVLDVPTIETGVLEPTVSNQLSQELVSDSDDTFISLRPFARWQGRYEPIYFAGDTPRQVRVVEGGVYLITGGLGGFGLVFAEFLARTTRARLVLTSRTAFPAESEWNALLEDEETSAIIRGRIGKLRTIVAAGGKVSIVVADSSDTARMEQVVVECGAQFGAVHGIIHAAGLPSFSMLQRKSAADVRAVFAPKVQGVAWIQKCLGAADLDFVFLCSSISAVVPSFGLADYAAANAYLDAFASAFDRPGGTRVISVNWDTWSDVGMAKEMAAISSPHAITPYEAAEVFERVLGCPLSRIVVSTRDLNLVLKTVTASIEHGRNAVESLTPNQPASTSHPRPHLSVPYFPPEDEMETAVVEIWQELLGIDSIGRHDNFFELGGHSLLGTQVIARIRSRFRLDLPLRTVFESVTPADLADILRTTQWTSGARTAELFGMEREEIEI